MKRRKLWSLLLLAMVAVVATSLASCSKNKEHELELGEVPADDGTHPEIYSRYYGWWMYGTPTVAADGTYDWEDSAWGFQFDGGNKGEAYTGNDHWSINWYPKGNLIVTQSPQTGKQVVLEVAELGANEMKVRFASEGSAGSVYTLKEIAR